MLATKAAKAACIIMRRIRGVYVIINYVHICATNAIQIESDLSPCCLPAPLPPSARRICAPLATVPQLTQISARGRGWGKGRWQLQVPLSLSPSLSQLTVACNAALTMHIITQFECHQNRMLMLMSCPKLRLTFAREEHGSCGRRGKGGSCHSALGKSVAISCSL